MSENNPICGQCGSPLVAGHRFCGKCGAPVTTAGPTPASPVSAPIQPPPAAAAPGQAPVGNVRSARRRLPHPVLALGIVLAILAILGVSGYYASQAIGRSSLQKQLLRDWHSSDFLDISTLKLDFSADKVDLFGGVGDFLNTRIGSYTYEVVSPDQVRIDNIVYTITFNENKTTMQMSPPLVDTWTGTYQTWQPGLSTDG